MWGKEKLLAEIIDLLEAFWLSELYNYTNSPQFK